MPAASISGVLVHGKSRLFKTTAAIVTSSMLTISLPAGVARAELVRTEQIVNQAINDGERDQVATFLARADVQRQMVALGVDPAEAKARIDGLSSAEVHRIAGQLDQLPSGGYDEVAPIAGGVLLVLFVLLLIDILGWADVFPDKNTSKPIT